MIEQRMPETGEQKQERWRLEHEKLVQLGIFDEIPMSVLNVGDMVAVRHSNLIYQIYDVAGDVIIAGFDKKDGTIVRETLRRNDVRSAEGYQNAILEFRGLAGGLRISVDGDVFKMIDVAKTN